MKKFKEFVSESSHNKDNTKDAIKKAEAKAEVKKGKMSAVNMEPTANVTGPLSLGYMGR